MPVPVPADQERLRQVLHNFMSNAKKFVAPGGSIHIAVQTEPGYACFSLYNDGPALSEEGRETIWWKFQREKSDSNPNGSGLGLAIAAQILTLHGTDYGVRNKEQGVEFYFRLPIEQQ